MNAAAPRMNFLDRAIAKVAPGVALSRMQSRVKLAAVSTAISRKSGNYKGSMKNYRPGFVSGYQEGREREVTGMRAQDLIANEVTAASSVQSMAVNSVGPGLRPQSEPMREILGITDDQARDFQRQAEWNFKEWWPMADAGGRMGFGGLQYLAICNYMAHGEFINLPRWLDDPGRPFSLALLDVSPLRLKTPRDKMSDPKIRDGVELGEESEAVAGWIADPKDSRKSSYSLTSADFKRIPMKYGHRQSLFHVVRIIESGQVRGVSPFASAMKAFRDFADYLDFEIMGALAANAITVFLEPGPNGETPIFNPPDQTKQDETSTDYTQMAWEFEPGSVWSGPGRPHALKPERPSANFPTFVEAFLRLLASASGQPYEVVAKDFSKTTYSSARAALLEVWRLYLTLRTWLVERYCQPVWQMVQEEAYLRGRLTIPKGAPGFYEAMAAWCNASWIGPPRGYIDPAKEKKAQAEGLANSTDTLAGIWAEQGGDWETSVDQRGREIKRQKEKEVPIPGGSSAPAPEPVNLEDLADA